MEVFQVTFSHENWGGSVWVSEEAEMFCRLLKFDVLKWKVKHRFQPVKPSCQLWLLDWTSLRSRWMSWGSTTQVTSVRSRMFTGIMFAVWIIMWSLACFQSELHSWFLFLTEWLQLRGRLKVTSHLYFNISIFFLFSI